MWVRGVVVGGEKQTHKNGNFILKLIITNDAYHLQLINFHPLSSQFYAHQTLKSNEVPQTS